MVGDAGGVGSMAVEIIGIELLTSRPKRKCAEAPGMGRGARRFKCTIVVPWKRLDEDEG